MSLDFRSILGLTASDLGLFFLPEPREIGGQTLSFKFLDNLQPFFPGVELPGYGSIPGFSRGQFPGNDLYGFSPERRLSFQKSRVFGLQKCPQSNLAGPIGRRDE